MKYWKGNADTVKENNFGTMSDNGFVPDSVEITKAEYNALIALIPPEPQLKAIYAAAPTVAAKVDMIAQMLKLL